MIWVWIFLLVAFIAIAIVLRAALTCAAGWKVWVCYQLGWLHSLIFCRWRGCDVCPIPETGPAIIVANHSSPVDPNLLWRRHFASFRRRHLRLIEFMMAQEYYEQRGPVGWVCRAMQCIPVSRAGRDMGPVKLALTRLCEGNILGLFPEGRINAKSADTKLLPGGTGVAWLALKSGVPVIPAFIHSAPRSESMVWVFFKFARSSVIYGDPLDLSAWREKKLTHAVLAEVTDMIMKSIADLGGIQFTPTTNHSGIRYGKDTEAKLTKPLPQAESTATPDV